MQMFVRVLVTSHTVGTVRIGIWLAHQEPEMRETPSCNIQTAILIFMVIHPKPGVKPAGSLTDHILRTPMNATHIDTLDSKSFSDASKIRDMASGHFF
jgi:hypothetical protein